MNKPLFIFFGCSWTWGRFINWHQFNVDDPAHMPADIEAEQSRLFSYRSLISKHFDADQINFSEGGSSNNRQFRKAAEYFLGVKNDSDSPLVTFDRGQYDKVVVLWFITATARTELFNEHRKTYDYFSLSYLPNPRPGTGMGIARELLKQGYYSDSEELKKTSAQMILWNSWFMQNNIQNVWVDTFNHNDWLTPISNQIKFDSGFSDLMTNMYLTANLGKPLSVFEKHQSQWVAEEQRSVALRDAGYLNSVSLHPTVKGHRLIADILLPKLENVIAQGATQ